MKHLQKNWWMMAVNGILAILFGAFALFSTETAMISISMYFGLLILVGGILLLLGAFDLRKKQKDYALTLAEAVVLIILGILILIFPKETLKVFLVIIGVWALLLGLFKIYIALAVKNMPEFRSILITGGLILLVIGLLLLVNPAFIAGIVLKIVGVVLLLVGIFTIYFSFKLKNVSA
jgi:uncharacterized membrane protein HdeD (DUF308 family)